MSHKRPNSPPPPYSYSYVHPTSSQVPKPPLPTYGYVQTPVMLPAPMPVFQSYTPQPQPQQPAPTHYVINHVYHQPPQQESVRLEEVVEWAKATPATAAALSHKAFIGGTVGDNPLWVIRAHHCGELVPGKYSVKDRAAYISYGGKEISVKEFEVLLAQPHLLHWVPSDHGQVPFGSFPAGNTAQGEPLYIARAKHTSCQYTIPGKVHPSHGCCYIPFWGSEYAYKNYEVLCKVNK